MRALKLASSHGTKNGVVVLRRSYKRVKVLVAALICISALVAGFQSDWFQKKIFYPHPYRGFVVEYAEVYHLDPALVAGVILSESRFKIEAESHKGAKGLMQLMPTTAKWIAEQLDEPQFTIEELQDPEVNIRFGTWYLSSLEKEFGGNEVLMLAAYNAGRGNVKEWMKQYHWDMSFHDMAQIPFKETREYVAKVLRHKAAYQKLYMD